MFNSVRQAMVALALLALGGGHAACACAAVAQAVSGPEIASAAPERQTDHTASHETQDAGHCATDSGDPDHECAGCETIALPKDTSAKTANVYPADSAVLPEKPSSETPGLFKRVALKAETARGPPRPGPSLVTLKIRLQN